MKTRQAAQLLCIALIVVARLASAEPRFTGTVSLSPPQDLSALIGKPIERIDIVVVGERWGPAAPLKRVTVGQVFSPSVARLAMQELVDSGGYANVTSAVSLGARGVIMTLRVLPRRLLARIKIPGGVLPEDATLEAAKVARGDAITLLDVPDITTRVKNWYLQHGFVHPDVRLEIVETDEKMKVVLLIYVDPGPSQTVKRRQFLFDRAPSEELQDQVDAYGVDVGERIDEEALTTADRELSRMLKASGWYQAEVSHVLSGATLRVHVAAGPRVRVSFEGNRSFDASELEAALNLADNEERSASSLIERIKDYYRARGFFDAEVEVRSHGGPKDAIVDQTFVIRENVRVRVVDRQYPCLTGNRAPADLSDEIDGFLTAALPGGDTLFSAPDPAAIDAGLGPHAKTGARVRPLDLEPWATYAPDVYANALQHIQELYRSEGYLSATAGPLQVLRRQCDPRSKPGQCIPIGSRSGPVYPCTAAPGSAPEKPVATTYGCVPDAKHGRYCEPDVVVRVPVKIGPQTTLYDIVFEGNRTFLGPRLAAISELKLGAPASYLELENAQRKVQAAYAEEGFAFATVEAELELSPDRTRARAVFVISERERVYVKDVVVEGAEVTREDLILSRAAFSAGSLYRRSDARRTEELLATLGTFSSVSVALEDPDVPASRKTVIISVRERPSQYLEVSPGVSTGEGVRMTMEYGHRNVNGSAIQFRLRTQLGFLPDVLILDDEVRRKYGELPIGERLERRNTAALEFPEIGLGPLFRLIVEGVDVRDNSRDYGITKDALLVTLAFRPNNSVTTSLRGSLELNNAEIFGQNEKDALVNYLRNNNSPLLQRLLNVPQGQTLAVAQRASLFWDRRDNPFGATRGTFFTVSAEHVNAFALQDNLSLTSQFMHYTGRVAGYLRLSGRGLTLAASLSGGYNQQLVPGSQTYPDRLFFLGGADSVRGFSQASIIPEDLARRILDKSISVNEVTIRGGDVFINPRVELRIPLTASWQTALFVDSGNLWLDARRMDPFTLRYSAGTGLRTMTPIGPLALDYGINLDRRPWEDFGAFHFSIGLF